MRRYAIEYTRDGSALGDERAIDEIRVDAWDIDHAHEIAEKALSPFRAVNILTVREVRS